MTMIRHPTASRPSFFSSFSFSPPSLTWYYIILPWNRHLIPIHKRREHARLSLLRFNEFTLRFGIEENFYYSDPVDSIRISQSYNKLKLLLLSVLLFSNVSFLTMFLHENGSDTKFSFKYIKEHCTFVLFFYSDYVISMILIFLSKIVHFQISKTDQ